MARRRKRQRTQKRNTEAAPKMSVEDAMAMAEDLPDGAYFTMVEELSGYDACAVAEYLMANDNEKGSG